MLQLYNPLFVILLTNERKESGVVVRHNKERHVGEATAGLEVAE